MDADQASAAQYQGQDPRAANLTPTSDYSLNPSSARSGSFPEYIQRSYGAGQAPGGMAQQQSPSMPLSDGQANDHHQQQQLKSDSDVPIDPSIAAATSPTYSHQQQYSPYTPHHDMQHYPGHPQTPMYASRPEWAGQYPQPGMHYGHPASSGPPAPAMVSPVQRPPTVSLRDCDQSTHMPHAPGHGSDSRVCLQRTALTNILGRPSSLHCILVCPDPRRAAAQETASTIRRNRAHVQVRLERMRKGLWYSQSLECARHDAIARSEANSRR